VRGLSLAALALPALGCAEPDVFLPPSQAGGPMGVVEGAVTYQGPLPCTAGGRVTGVAAIFAFDARLLPPPDGLGTSAASFVAVTGTELFAGVRERLTFDPYGAPWCPDAKAAPATVSAAFALGPLPAGDYQLRGFYDHDGDFDPAFSIANLPTAGDVGGGAIENAAGVLAGEAPVYRDVGLGALQKDGTRRIPDEGARVTGVAVTLGLPIETERPIFHAAEVLDPTKKNRDAARVVMPSDFQLDVFDPTQIAATEASLLRLKLAAGVAKDEAAAAAAVPFRFPTKDPRFLFTRQDVNRDGAIDAKDHVPDSALVPSLYPLSVFARLGGGSTVIVQGLTIAESLVSTGLSAPTLHATKPEVIVGVRPSVVCLDPLSPKQHAVLVVTHEADRGGRPVVADPGAVTSALAAQLGRPVDLVYGCLPEGRYSINLVYGTGQAWTTPNEAGVCAPSEAASGARVCGSRARLPSQDAFLTSGPPGDAAYCKKHPAPAACK
jgi:hypothetical protein